MCGVFKLQTVSSRHDPNVTLEQLHLPGPNVRSFQMMLCSPYRCAQDRKSFRRHLCSWSGKALALVGLEEVLVSAYGEISRDKLPFTEVSEILSKAIDSIENDSNRCGICGKSKKAPPRKIPFHKPVYPSPVDVIDLTGSGPNSVDQPIDLSCTKNSKLPYASPSGDLSGLYSSHSARIPNGISHKAKRQRVGGPSDMPLVGEGIDQNLINQLVNNWSKANTIDLRSNSPTTSPNNYPDVPGPSNTAAARSGPSASRPHHHNRASAAATAGSVQKTSNKNTGALLTGEPSDISSSTLSDQDAVNRFKQWRVASWVQEASRHQRDGSAVPHHEDAAQDSHLDSSSLRLSSTRASGNTSATIPANLSISRNSPISSVLRNATASNNDASKSALRKRSAMNCVSSHSQHHHQPKHAQSSPPHSSAQQHHKPHTGHDAKRSRQDAQTSSAAAGGSQQTASLNNLASVLASLFPSAAASTSSNAAVPTSLASGTSANDLDALLALALQNWTSQTAQAAAGAQTSSQHTTDPTAALLTAAYQQQMQQAALLQLQYSQIFNNPLFYSNLLLGGAASTATPTTTTSTAPSNNLASLANALGTSLSSPSNVDSVLTEALLAMLGNGNPGATNHAVASAPTTSSAKRHTPDAAHGRQQHQHSSQQSHRPSPGAINGPSSSPLHTRSSHGHKSSSAQLVKEKAKSEAVAEATDDKRAAKESADATVSPCTASPAGEAERPPGGTDVAGEDVSLQRPSNNDDGDGAIRNGFHENSEKTSRADQSPLRGEVNGNGEEAVEDEKLPAGKLAKQLALDDVKGPRSVEISEDHAKLSRTGSRETGISGSLSDLNNDSRSSAPHVEEEEEQSSSPLPPTPRNDQTAEIVDLQTTA